MRTRSFDIECGQRGKLLILERPRGGEWLGDHIASWAASGVHIVVSLLTDDEIAELGLTDEQIQCERRGIEFVRFPIMDRGVPESADAARELEQKLSSRIRGGESVGVHCRASIGRSALLAACVLRSLGINAKTAFERIERARGVRVPDTDEQRVWVEQWT
jgi:protein-tyrosine phosphatase